MNDGIWSIIFVAFMFYTGIGAYYFENLRLPSIFVFVVSSFAFYYSFKNHNRGKK